MGGHRAKCIAFGASGAWGRAHWAWRAEQGDLQSDFLSSDIWLPDAGYELRDSRYGLHVAGSELQGTGCA
jgi:hypothetical protein